jgi:hypothetical protein
MSWAPPDNEFRNGLSDIQGAFKKYTKRDLPRFYSNLKRLASDQSGDTSPLIECENGSPFVYAGSFDEIQ